MTWQFELTLSKKDLQTLRDVVLRLGLEGKEEARDLLAAHSSGRRVRVPVAEDVGRSDISRLEKYSFALRYLIESLITHGIVVPSEINELSESLTRHCDDDEDKIARVLHSLYTEERIRNIDTVVMGELRNQVSADSAVCSQQLGRVQAHTDDNSVLVYHGLVTPTRLVLLPPELETSTDALRNHLPFSDRFLRVEFIDEEDGFQINPTVLAADSIEPAEGTVARVRRAMTNGLKIAGRHYVFLAYGANSARTQSCWFLAEEAAVGLTVQTAMRTLGLDKLSLTNKVVAEHVSKMAIVSHLFAVGSH